MPFNCPDIETFKVDLDRNVAVALSVKADSHGSIRVQSLLNITIYALATRFLEGSLKLIIYNCARMRGDNAQQLTALESELKKINNPEYSNIRAEVLRLLNFDIVLGYNAGRFTNKDITFLNEIVRNRHRNVHATHDPADWHSTNSKDILSDFNKEYPGLINILTYLDSLTYNQGTGAFQH
ncbi:MAG: hypothetical protein IT271_03265 [Chitinophagales bacterium]|nr:hypothetical protein [Chitinophagales bacterium]